MTWRLWQVRRSPPPRTVSGAPPAPVQVAAARSPDRLRAKTALQPAPLTAVPRQGEEQRKAAILCAGGGRPSFKIKAQLDFVRTLRGAASQRCPTAQSGYG